MSIKDLLEALDRKVLFESKETFKQDELTPVIINPPAGKSKPLPPQKGGKQIDVEVINTGPPPKSDQDAEDGEAGEDGDSQDGDDNDSQGKSSKETKKTDKPGDKKSKAPGTVDSHEIMNKWSDAGEAKEIAEKILEKSKKTREKREDGSDGVGLGEGHFMDKLRKSHEPKINWVQELRKKLTAFKSQTSQAASRWSRKGSDRYKEGQGVQKSKAYHQWLKDPRSHSGGQMIFKGPYVKAPINEMVLIVALDTSGSIPATTVSKVFAEMDKIAKGFKAGISHGGASLEGKVYFMSWDSNVQQVEEYKPGEWKKYAKGERHIEGGGGTNPASIFKYLNDHFLFDKEKPSAGLLNVLKKPSPTGMSKDDIVIPIKDGKDDPKAAMAPFVIIATDGQFFGSGPADSDLGILYKDNKEKILYLIIDGTDKDAYPKNIINYETYRV